VYEDGQPLPIQATQTRAGVLWTEACALADQLLLTGLLPDLGGDSEQPAHMPAAKLARPSVSRRSRAIKQDEDPQLSLLEAGWPTPQRFPHNSRLTNVRDIVDRDLLAAENPLVITGFVSLDSLLALLDRVHRSARVEDVRLLLGFEPYASGRTAFRVGGQRFANEIADYWLEQGISLYLSGAVLSAIELLKNGRASARISSERRSISWSASARNTL
jgi:hypothetical protein